MGPQQRCRDLEIPTDLIERVEERLPRTEWDEPEQYVTHVLEEVLFHVEQETTDPKDESVDESEIEDRLKSLGYLDS